MKSVLLTPHLFQSRVHIFHSVSVKRINFPTKYWLHRLCRNSTPQHNIPRHKRRILWKNTLRWQCHSTRNRIYGSQVLSFAQPFNSMSMIILSSGKHLIAWILPLLWVLYIPVSVKNRLMISCLVRCWGLWYFGLQRANNFLLILSFNSLWNWQASSLWFEVFCYWCGQIQLVPLGGSTDPRKNHGSRTFLLYIRGQYCIDFGGGHLSQCKIAPVKTVCPLVEALDNWSLALENGIISVVV
jgi:hypothetical protein